MWVLDMSFPCVGGDALLPNVLILVYTWYMFQQWMCIFQDCYCRATSEKLKYNFKVGLPPWSG